MAIDRAPFNALVDDDGSNTLGTPWNKAAIAGTLLDPIDAAIDATVSPWVDVPFNAANFTAAGGTWTVSAANVLTFILRRDKNLVTVFFYLQNTTIGGSAATLTIAVPGYTWRNWSVIPIAVKTTAGTAMAIAQNQIGTNAITILRDFAVTPFPAGACDLGGTVLLPL